ncbi:MAG TPA: type II secretory pathway protein, partial [Flavobacteriaceae bacterium]|nr:type II secretory pathway protein [Flavobacteriaceae bacterium]
PEENILVKAYIYEVSYSTEDGSAIGLVLNIANQKLKINMGSQEPLTNFVNFSSNALGILFSNINTDTRFKLLSNPYLRVKNNKQSAFNVGQSVPVLGSISYQGNNGTPVQEVKYVDTGLSF